MFLPFGGGDPVFGDGGDESPTGSAKGSDGEESDEEEPFFLDEITSTRQTIYIPDEDLQLLFEGWGEKTYKSILWSIGVILSLGMLSLLGKWIPEWWLGGRGKMREFGRATKVVVKVSLGLWSVTEPMLLLIGLCEFADIARHHLRRAHKNTLLRQPRRDLDSVPSYVRTASDQS